MIPLRTDFAFTHVTPYFALTSERLCVFHETCTEIWPRCIEGALFWKDISVAHAHLSTIFISWYLVIIQCGDIKFIQYINAGLVHFDCYICRQNISMRPILKQYVRCLLIRDMPVLKIEHGAVIWYSMILLYVDAHLKGWTSSCKSIPHCLQVCRCPFT